MTYQATRRSRGPASIGLNTGRHLEREMAATRRRANTRTARSWYRVGAAMNDQITKVVRNPNTR